VGSKPIPKPVLSTDRVSRRQILKSSLIGLGSLAAAVGGLAPLEILGAASPGTGSWRQVFPGSTPSPRIGAAVAYDAGRKMPVLFGGDWADSGTWAWNGLAWNRLTPSVSPPARTGASCAYHPPTDTVVLFGGLGTEGRLLGDTWLWNGVTWTQAPGGARPRARESASMAFDPVSGGLILFGGASPVNLNSPFNDTWMWNGGSWIQLSPSSSPLARYGTSLAYNSTMGRLILFGGKRSPMGVPEPLATWAWDGMNWSEISVGPLPPWRLDASMAAAGGGVLLFGGFSFDIPPSPSYLGDTWTLGTTWSEVIQTPSPAPRAGASLVPDPPRNSLLLFGGASGPGRLANDTWVWELS